MGLLHDGQRVGDTYEVERFLGEGAFAEVYRVKHRFLGRQAMKVFKTAAMNLEETEALLGEAIMLSTLGHPNIVRVYDANVTATSEGFRGFFTMEYVAGGTLDQFWRSHGSRFVAVPTAVEIARQLCRGLSVAHGATPPIVHRDIKPRNILVGYDAHGLRVRVSDFGLAKRVNPLTLLASARGTPAFKPPEVFRDPRSDSRAADVWAIGATLYLLLTDRLPFIGRNGSELDPCALEQPLVPPSRVNIQSDETIDAIVAGALAPRPEERYPSAVEMMHLLEGWAPPRKVDPWNTASSFDSKDALGECSPLNESEGRRLAARATELAQQASQLGDAADMMEEAFNRWPSLRGDYERRVRLWRCGIVG